MSLTNYNHLQMQIHQRKSDYKEAKLSKKNYKTRK